MFIKEMRGSRRRQTVIEMLKGGSEGTVSEYEIVQKAFLSYLLPHPNTCSNLA